MLAREQIAAAVDTILQYAAAGDTYIDRMAHMPAETLEQVELSDHEFNRGAAEWNLHLAYTAMLVLVEALGLPVLRAEIAAVRDEAVQSLAEMEVDEEGNFYAKWARPVRRYAKCIQDIHAIEPEQTVTKDIASLLRNATYAITDESVFGSLPRKEGDVQQRVEAVLKPVFPDLAHQTALPKGIKNYIADIGIPSLRTLIELKYAETDADIKRMADEMLADTRGYHSEEWDLLIFAIYETRRLRTEEAWRTFLRDSGCPSTITAVVMPGR